MITIRMPKEYLSKWLAALRSGEYKQGRLELQTPDGKFCCLGVLEHCIEGEVELCAAGVSAVAPTVPWLKERNIEFMTESGDKTNVPYLPSVGISAIKANDTAQLTFLEIADAIEACAEGV